MSLTKTAITRVLQHQNKTDCHGVTCWHWVYYLPNLLWFCTYLQISAQFNQNRAEEIRNYLVTILQTSHESPNINPKLLCVHGLGEIPVAEVFLNRWTAVRLGIKASEKTRRIRIMLINALPYKKSDIDRQIGLYLTKKAPAKDKENYYRKSFPNIWRWNAPNACNFTMQ